METKPTAFHSVDEWVSESQISAAATIYNPTVPDKKAPTAEPEGEEIDMEVSPEIKKPGMSETKVTISQCAHAGTESTAELNSNSMEIRRSLSEDEFPPPPLDFTDLPIEESSDQDFCVEVIAVEWMDSDISTPVHDRDSSQKGRNDVFNVDSRDTTSAIYVQDGNTENISTNLTVGECTENKCDCIVPSLPFADESDEDAEADKENFKIDQCDASESGVTVPVDDLEHQGEQSPQRELSPVRHIQAFTVSTSSDCHEFAVANEGSKDEEACINSMHNLDFMCDISDFTASTLQMELSLQYEVPLVSDIQSSEEVGESEDTVEPNAFPEELTETTSGVISPLFANDNNAKSYVDVYNNSDNEREVGESEALPDELYETDLCVHCPPFVNDNEDEDAYSDTLHNSDYLSNASESTVSTSSLEAVSEQQEELSLPCEVFPVSESQSCQEDCVDNLSVGVFKPKALPDELSHTNSSVHSQDFANENDDEEAYTNTMHNFDYKSNIVQEYTASTFPLEDISKQKGQVTVQCKLSCVSDRQSSQEYCADVLSFEIGESEDSEPIAFSDELTNLSTFPCSNEHIVWSPVFANKTNEDEEADNNTLQNSDDMFDLAALLAVDVSEQQEELFQQNKLPPLGVNQEATQQVLSQASPPLSTVSMEPANHDALSEGGGGVIEKSRVGHGTVVGENRLKSADERLFKDSRAVGPIREVLKWVQEQESEKPTHVSFQHRSMESDSCDESDSGVSADFSPGSTLESSSSTTSVHKETPIEREIRRAIEREHSLRRSRGLPNPPTSPEYVDIPLRKVVSYQPLPPTKSDKCQSKDRQFAGKKMQQDIYEEAQREQDLVKLGKIPGFYDKGTVRQLKEKKMLFEAFQKPSDSCSVKSKAISSSNCISFSENDTLCLKAQGTGHDTRKELTIKSPRAFPEAKSCQIIIIENNLELPTARPNTSTGTITVANSSTEKNRKIQDEKVLDLKTPMENPFFKLRSSSSVVKVEQDIREAQERERDLHKQRINLYGPRLERGGGRPAGTEEQSGALSSPKALPVQHLPDSSQTGQPQPQQPLQTTTTTSAARHSSGRLGVWPPAPSEKNHQTEVHQCPRTPRQKNPLVQRWESGLINPQED